MAFLVHHCIRWWHRAPKFGMENLDLDDFIVCGSHPLRLLHVSRGMFYIDSVACSDPKGNES